MPNPIVTAFCRAAVQAAAAWLFLDALSAPGALSHPSLRHVLTLLAAALVYGDAVGRAFRR